MILRFRWSLFIRIASLLGAEIGKCHLGILNHLNIRRTYPDARQFLYPAL
jgi:hypothetical protein